MNLYVATGWISREAEERTQASTGREMVMFSLTVEIPGPEEFCELKMRVEDPALARKWLPWLTSGRVCMVRAMAKNVPIVRHGIIINETTAFVVLEAEFPNRSKAADGAEPAEPLGQSDGGKSA